MRLRALITRPEEDAMPLAHALSESGIAVAVEPLLAIRPVAEAAIDLTDVQAVLFTSANGVRVFVQLAAERNLPGWRDLPAFTVGHASAAAAEAAGFAHVESAGGEVAALAQLVTARLDPKAGPLFHGAGSAIAGDLAGALSAAGFELRRSMIYEARPAEHLTDGTIAALRERSIHMVLLFSPRTAATFVALARAAGDPVVTGCGQAVALCLSPAVASAAEDLPWRTIKSAVRPDMSAMLQLVAQCLEEMGEGTHEAPTPSVEDRMTVANQSAAAADAPVPVAAAPVGPPPPRRRQGWMTAVIAAATAAVVAGAIGGIWSQSPPVSAVTSQTAAAIDPALLAKLDEADSQVRAASSSIGELGDRLGGLSGDVDAVKRDLAELLAAAASSDGPLLPELGGLKGRLLAIELQFAELAKTKDQIAAFERQVADLTARQNNAAQGVSIDGATLDRLSSENQSLRAEIAALKSRLEPLAGLTGRIDALDLAVKEQSAGAANSALALAVGQLSSALATARPFAAEMNALHDLSGTDTAMATQLADIAAPLRDFSATGIPTVSDLKARFSTVASAVARLEAKTAMSDLAGIESNGSWFDRALDRLSSVIIVRPVGEVPGDAPTARVARAEALLQADDLGGALNELAGLTGEPAAAIVEWVMAAKARQAADGAIAALYVAAILRLYPDEATPLGSDG